MTDSTASPENPGPEGSPAGAPGADPLGPDAGLAPEVSRRVSSILDAVEREANRLRGEATEEAQRYLDYSRRRADDLVAERQRRIAELSDEIVSKAEAVVGRLEDAAPVREGFDNLVRALGDAAERLAREAENTAHDYEAPAFHDDEVQAFVGSLPPEQAPPVPPAPPMPPYGQPAASPPPVAPPTPDYDPPETYQPFPAPAQPPAPGYDAPTPTYDAPAVDPYPTPATPAGGEDWQGVDDARLVAIQMAAAGRTRGQVREHLHNQMGLGETRPILDEIFGAGSQEDARVPWTAFPR
jgi:hypothetical protein